jgi:hypothetical protein
MLDIGISASRLAELAALLTSGGDRRLELDPYTGRSKYHCPLLPSPNLICLSSCTASPLSVEGWQAAIAMFRRLAEGSSVQGEACAVAAGLRRLLELDGLAEVLLAPSGTDATLLAAGLLAAEQPGTPLISIMVAASETGSGVPQAAAGCHFSDLAAGTALVTAGAPVDGFDSRTATITIALRDADGNPRPPPEVDADFAAAVAGAPGRPVVHLMDGSKTGLVAPTKVADSVDVLVDACQLRLPIERLHRYIRRGWPVLITGSKFFGGPAFSGAILFPTARLARIDRAALPCGLAAYGVDPDAAQPAANCGTVLRWAAALDEMTGYFAASAVMGERLRRLSQVVAAGFAALPELVAVPAPDTAGIFTFALRAPGDPDRCLSSAELRRLHRAMAYDGVLLGQPVDLTGRFGGLRLAIGARTLRDPNADQSIARSLEVLRQHLRRVSTAP